MSIAPVDREGVMQNEEKHKNFIHILNYSDKEFAEMYLEDQEKNEENGDEE